VNILIQRLSVLTRLYVECLGRLPDMDGIRAHLAMESSPEAMIAAMLRAEEYERVSAAVAAMRVRLEQCNGRRPVLLFGAFGNGNLGDRMMAQTVAEKLEQRDDILCFAYSELASADYPFPAGRRLSSSDMPLNLRVMALFDAMVIGGGGLLSYTHEPLWDSVWPHTLSIPYGILSCGVGSPLDDRLINLVRTARTVSARDEKGRTELAHWHENALLCPDPLLAFHPMAHKRPPPGQGRLFILRAPLAKWHLQLRNCLRPSDAVAIFEAHVDHAITSTFENVAAINDSRQFIEFAKNFELVVTERFHGAIFALLARVPVHGILRSTHSDKMEALFSCLGLDDRLSNHESIEQDFAAYDLTSALTRIEEIRSNADSVYDAFLSSLLDERRDRPSITSQSSAKSHNDIAAKDDSSCPYDVLYEARASLEQHRRSFARP
jgi:polysaccharide pyruvyl transferase WcaK-like protein